MNLPVPGGSGDAVYRSLVAHVVAPLVEAWEPQLVLVSAGFDAHRVDPLASCTVTEAGFAGMTATLRASATRSAHRSGSYWRAATTWLPWPARWPP